MSELFCIGCQQKKYGPTAGICFDCWNMLVQRKKLDRRAKRAAK